MTAIEDTVQAESPEAHVAPGDFVVPEPRDADSSLIANFDRSRLPDLQAGTTAIFYCTRGDTRMEFTQSLLALTQHSHTRTKVIAAMGRIASGNLALHRNEAIEDFLITGAEWAWLLDDDEQIAPDTLDKLHEVADVTGVRVVGGLYSNIGMDGNLIPMAYFFDPDTDRIQNYSAANIGRMIRDGGKSALVGSTGCGCLLIHRDVIVEMLERFGAPMPWFANDIALDLVSKIPVVQGEDHTFFRRLREIGHQIHVRLDTEITHYKIMAIDNDHLVRQAEAALAAEATDTHEGPALP